MVTSSRPRRSTNGRGGSWLAGVHEALQPGGGGAGSKESHVAWQCVLLRVLRVKGLHMPHTALGLCCLVASGGSE
jgi:hypothetical protein